MFKKNLGYCTLDYALGYYILSYSNIFYLM